MPKAVGFFSLQNHREKLSSKYGQILDTTKKLTINALITASKRPIQKIAEAITDEP